MLVGRLGTPRETSADVPYVNASPSDYAADRLNSEVPLRVESKEVAWQQPQVFPALKGER